MITTRIVVYESCLIVFATGPAKVRLDSLLRRLANGCACAVMTLCL